jgi:hypothetical protein
MSGDKPKENKEKLSMSHEEAKKETTDDQQASKISNV